MNLEEKEILELIHRCGRFYYNQDMENKDRFLETVKSEHFPNHETEKLAETLDKLHQQFMDCQRNGLNDWVFYGAMEKAIQLAQHDLSITKRCSILVTNLPNDSGTKSTQKTRKKRRASCRIIENTAKKQSKRNDHPDAQEPATSSDIDQIKSMMKEMSDGFMLAIANLDQRQNETNVLLQTVINGQQNTDQKLKQIHTDIKSVSAGQKVLYDLTLKKRE